MAHQNLTPTDSVPSVQPEVMDGAHNQHQPCSKVSNLSAAVAENLRYNFDIKVEFLLHVINIDAGEAPDLLPVPEIQKLRLVGCIGDIVAGDGGSRTERCLNRFCRVRCVTCACMLLFAGFWCNRGRVVTMRRIGALHTHDTEYY